MVLPSRDWEGVEKRVSRGSLLRGVICLAFPV